MNKPMRSASCFYAIMVGCLGVVLLLSGKTYADSSISADQPPNFQRGGPPPTGNSALDAALKACGSSVSKDSNGRPDHTAMDACMKAKGFSPPQGGPHHGMNGEPPSGPPPD